MKHISALALTVLGISILAWLSGGPGHRFGLWSYGTGFTLMRWAAYGGIAAALLGAIPVTATLWRAKRLSAFLSIIAGLGMVMTMMTMLNKARSLPSIHDISTNLADPPYFTTIPARDEAERGFPKAQHDALQQVYYPDIQPLQSTQNVEQTTKAFHQILLDMGMVIAAFNPNQGQIEATDTTFWFGFKDDIVIRVRANEGGSVVDIRSVSRVGRSDIGKNAERIRNITAHVPDRLP